MTALAVAGIALFAVALVVLVAASGVRVARELRTIRRMGLRRRLELFVAEQPPEPPETRGPR